MKRRTYTDTSVIGGCLDAEYEEASQLLIGAFERGDATIVFVQPDPGRASLRAGRSPGGRCADSERAS